MSAKPLPLLRGSDEVPLDGLRDKQVAIIGYGNQGRAHALNLRDSGIDVVIGARHPERPTTDGFQTMSLSLAAASDLVILALPDEVHGNVYDSDIRDNLKPNATLGFMHGFSIHYEQIKPANDIGVILIAPKGPGVSGRQRFVEGSGVPALLAISQENATNSAKAIALGWAAGIGSGRVGVLESTFADETETDLFGEQAIIVGGLTTLVKASFEILVDAGYPPQLAYIECCHEVKQVADIMHEKGILEMMSEISSTAEMGAYEAIDVLDDERLRTKLQHLLRNIQDGTFANRFINGKIKSKRSALANHEIEGIGKEIRSLMHRGTD